MKYSIPNIRAYVAGACSYYEVDCTEREFHSDIGFLQQCPKYFAGGNCFKVRDMAASFRGTARKMEKGLERKEGQLDVNYESHLNAMNNLTYESSFGGEKSGSSLRFVSAHPY